MATARPGAQKRLLGGAGVSPGQTPGDGDVGDRERGPGRGQTGRQTPGWGTAGKGLVSRCSSRLRGEAARVLSPKHHFVQNTGYWKGKKLKDLQREAFGFGEMRLVLKGSCPDC